MLSELRDSVVALVADWAYERREEPFELSQGHRSHDYIDAKRALADFSRMKLVGDAVLELTGEMGVDFEAVGGMVFGATPLAVSISIASAMAGTPRPWFTVLKEEKVHGKQQQIVGADLRPGMSVLLVDDVATTGQSIIDALDVLEPLQVNVVMALVLVDRSDSARGRLNERGIKYEPLVTYRDLGIEPVPVTPVLL